MHFTARLKTSGLASSPNPVEIPTPLPFSNYTVFTPVHTKFSLENETRKFPFPMQTSRGTLASTVTFG